MTLRLGLTILGVVIVALLVIGFIRDPFGLRKNAEHRAEVQAVETQDTANKATSAASDQTARDVRVIVQKGEKEIQYVQTSPGADRPTEPERRDRLCAALGRVLDTPQACDASPDAIPAPAL